MADLAINGDSAIALAWKQIDPDVCAAYPITPQTIIVERFSDYVADGEVNTNFVCVESEHSALTLCAASSSAGARTFTATASQGLAYMWEMLPITSAMRTPVVMAVANRALSGPININNDHSDAMAARDCGWVMLFAENVQEAYDNAVMAPRIAEHHDVQLPIMTNIDGFILTHAVERMTPLDAKDVKKFVGDFKPLYPLLDWKNPVTHGSMDSPEYYYKHKYQMVEAMENAIGVTEKVFKDFKKISGREYNLVEEYMCGDAEFVAVVLGSSYGTMKAVVDELRAEGKKVGAVMPRLFRPWPDKHIAAALKGKKGVAVLDKHAPIGAYGALYTDICATLIDMKDAPAAYNYIYGLGGKDATAKDFRTIFEDMMAGKAAKYTFMGADE